MTDDDSPDDGGCGTSYRSGRTLPGWLAGIPDDWGAVLAAIRTARRAWIEDRELAAALGLAQPMTAGRWAELTAVCAAMAADSPPHPDGPGFPLVARWDYFVSAERDSVRRARERARAEGKWFEPEPPPLRRVGWTFSVDAAADLAVELAEAVEGADPRWVDAEFDRFGVRVLREPPAANRPGEVRCAWLDRLAWPAKEEVKGPKYAKDDDGNDRMLMGQKVLVDEGKYRRKLGKAKKRRAG